MKTNKYIIEFIIFFAYVLFGASWTAGGQFIPNIMEEQGIKTLAAGSFMTIALSIAKIIGSFIAAGILVKLMPRKSIILAMSLISLGVFVPFAPNYAILVILRFIVGLGGALLLVYFSPVIMTWFKPEERPTVNGINAIAFNTGVTIILFSVTFMTDIFGGWKNTLLVISGLSVVFLVLWIIFGSDGDQPLAPTSTQDKGSYTVFDGIKVKTNWILGIGFGGINSFYIILFTFYPKAGIEAAKWAALAGIIATPIGIWLANKSTRRVSILRIAGVMQMVGVIGLHCKVWGLIDNDFAITLFGMLAGFGLFLPMSSLYCYLQEQKGMTPAKVAVNFSIFWSLVYAVGTIAPLIFGFIHDQTHDYKMPLVFVTAISSFFLISSMLLKDNEVVKKDT